MHLWRTSFHTAIALCAIAGQDSGWAEDVPATIERAVLAELGDTISMPDRPVVRQFARVTVQALRQVPEPDEAQRQIIVRSIVQAVADALADQGGEPESLYPLLFSDWQQRRTNLQAVTPEMLSRDWTAAQEQYQAERQWVENLVRNFWHSRPVLLLDLAVNADLAGRSSVGSDEHQALSLDAQENFLEHVRTSLQARLPAADSLGSVFVMAQFPYEPLSEESKQAVREYLERCFVLDEAIIVPRQRDAQRAISDVAGVLFGRELAGLPTPEERIQRVRNEFQLLVQHKLLNHSILVTFGGEISDELRTGRHFGVDIEQMPSVAVPVEQRDEFTRQLRLWTFSMRSRVPMWDDLASQLLLDMLTEWATRVVSLKECLGDRAEEDVDLSPVQRQLLTLLRRARLDNPVFTDRERPMYLRVQEFERFLISPEVSYGKVATNVTDRWKLVDRHDYLEVINSLHEWLQREYQREQQVRTHQRVSRAETLLRQLESDMLDLPGLGGGEATEGPLAPVVARVLERIERQGERFGRGAASGELPPVEKAVEEYVRVAIKHHPLFQELGKPLSEQQRRERDAAYVAGGRAVEEQQARQAALAAVQAELRRDDRPTVTTVVAARPVAESGAAVSGGAPPLTGSVGETGGGWRLPLLWAVLTAAAGLTAVACRRLRRQGLRPRRTDC